MPYAQPSKRTNLCIWREYFFMETFRYIPEHENYMISDLGKVESIARTILKTDGTIQTYKSRMLSISISSNGYPCVTLTTKGKSRMYGIHSLIALAFLDKDYISKGLIANHKDGIKKNSYLSNIEITTYSSNLIHAHQNGLNKNIGETHTYSKFSNQQIEEIKKLISEKVNLSIISEKYKISKVYLRQIRRGFRKNNLR